MTPYVYDAAAMRDWEDFSMAEQGISALELMDRAVVALINTFTKLAPEPCSVLVFAGHGNNGGDAIGMAVALHQLGYRVQLWRIPALACSAENQAQWEKAMAAGVPLLFETDLFYLRQADWVIDGLLGMGTSRPARDSYAEAISLINRLEVAVFSIDLPSGMPPSSAFTDEWPIVRAHCTVCLQQFKFNCFLPPSGPYTGALLRVDIGLSARFRHLDRCAELNLAHEAKLLPKRARFSHKGSHGHALLIAGSATYPGTALLSTGACLRSGAGLSSLLTPARLHPAVVSVWPEALLQDAGADHWHLPIALTKYTALGIGMGLGQHADTRTVLLETLVDCRIPLLLDADALQLLRQEEAMQLLPAGTVLTPHLKEFDRLFGAQADWWSRLARAQALSEAHGWVIVLKNANTFVVAPGGKLYINLSGNPGLAKGGSGDVLSGIILALLAQGLQPVAAARLGVWLHGQAADLALATQHEHSLLASDVIAHLGAAFRALEAAT